MKTLWIENALLPSGWACGVRLTFDGGRIQGVETDVAPADGDSRIAIGIPGMPNLHSHAFQRGLAGLTERRGPEGDSFWTWRERMYEFVERIGPQEVHSIAALVYAEMLESGFTQVGEFHYLHHDRGGRPYADPGELATRIVAAAADAGIGLTLLPTFYAHGGFGGRDPNPRQCRFINGRESFARIVESCRKAVTGICGGCVGIAPHSLRAVTPDELTWLTSLEASGPIHIHIAEQEREVEDCIAWSGRRPVQWLLEHTRVDERWCLVHATHLTEPELQGIAASGAVAGLCPITEANLGDGIFPGAEFLAASGRIGIGSDSNVSVDVAEELRTFEYSQRLARRARNVLAREEGESTGRALFDRALAGGAQVLRSPAGLATGAWLDLVSLDATHPALANRRGDEILDSWIFAGGRTLVDRVWRAGVEVVSGGRHRNREALVAGYQRATALLRS